MTVTSALTLRNDAATGLGQAVHELTCHQVDLDEFTRRFLAARVYTLRPVRPGPFVMSCADGTAIVPVWSSLRGLRQVMGNYDWCARTGAELVVPLPAGVGVLIDAGMAHPIALSNWQP